MAATFTMKNMIMVTFGTSVPKNPPEFYDLRPYEKKKN